MADTIKCPNCSANLFFEPASGKLECAYCGGSFDPAVFEKVVDELTAEPKEKVSEASVSETPEPETAAAEEARETDEDNFVTEDAEDTQQFVFLEIP